MALDDNIYPCGKQMIPFLRCNFTFLSHFCTNLHPGDSWPLVKWDSQQRMSIIDTLRWIKSGMTPVIALSQGPMMKCQHGEDPSLEVMTSQGVIVWLKSLTVYFCCKTKWWLTCKPYITFAFISLNMLLYYLEHRYSHIWHPNELIGTQCTTSITLFPYSTRRNPLCSQGYIFRVLLTVKTPEWKDRKKIIYF